MANNEQREAVARAMYAVAPNHVPAPSHPAWDALTDAALAALTPAQPGATHPAHWERHGHPGEPCPPDGCYGGAVQPDPPIAPSVTAEQVGHSLSELLDDDAPLNERRYVIAAGALAKRYPTLGIEVPRGRPYKVAP